MDSSTALQLSDVSVSYGKFVAVHSASLRVAAGELMSLVGPNGHGKSSLAMAIAGVVGRRGTVTAFGQPIPPGDPRSAVTAGIVLVPERRRLYPGMSVRDNILLGAYSKRRTPWAGRAWRSVADVVDVFPELSGRLAQAAGTLSGGQQQMVALARALAARPKVLLLDEPCLGLSEAVSHRVYDTLTALNSDGATIVLIEENPLRALEISHRLVQMYQGVIDETAGESGHAPAESADVPAADSGTVR